MNRLIKIWSPAEEETSPPFDHSPLFNHSPPFSHSKRIMSVKLKESYDCLTLNIISFKSE